MDANLRDVLSSIEDAVEFLGIEIKDVNQRGHFGNNPLKIAAVRGDLSAAQILLDAGADVNARLEDGFSALHHAATQGNAEVVRLLIQRGASPHAVTDDGHTALSLARLLDELTAVEILEGHAAQIAGAGTADCTATPTTRS